MKNSYFRLAFFFFFLLTLVPFGARAQYSTPTVDATYDGSPNYPTQTTVTGNNGAGSTKYAVTWNATDFFVHIDGANQTEPVSIFLDIDPIVPVNGGSNSHGTLVGKNYDG